MTEAKDTLVQSNGDKQEPVGTPESTVKPIDPNHPHLISVAGEKFRNAKEELLKMPAPSQSSSRR